MKIFLYAILFFVQIFSFAQSNKQSHLDSLYKIFVSIRGERFESEIPIEQHDEQHTKCGLGIVNVLQQNLNSFSPNQQKILKVLLQRPILDTSFVTPGGFFRVHYDNSGSRKPLYDLNELALALDSSYNFEINFLGYPPPASDNSEGGDNLYDIYIVDLGSGGTGLYGYTQYETLIGPDRYTSFMVIDNDYDGYYSAGIDGARVTVAHEFHHAIQGSNYKIKFTGSTIEDLFYYEITSTAMEEFVYDEVNDYYAYMPDYFQNPTRPFLLNNGYNLASWNIFLAKQFGFEILKRQWELLVNSRALSSINLSLSERGSTFSHELNVFGLWTYFTGYRNIPGRYFEEAANYPLINPTANVSFVSGNQINMSARATTNYFLKIADGQDSLVVIVSNSDIQNGTDSTSKFYDFSYTLFSDTSVGERKLDGIYSANFDADRKNFWSISEIYNNRVINGDTIPNPTAEEKNNFAFPQPYYNGKSYLFGSFINITLDQDLNDEVDLNIYTTAMELVYSSQQKVVFLPNGLPGVKWNVKDNNGKKVASGVYIYTIKVGDDVTTGKLVIFNE